MLYLLSPYRLPGRHTLMLNSEDTAAWLNGYLALWQPAAVMSAGSPPRIESPYDHENPLPTGVYALPENPPLYLPEDWETKARDAGAVFFRASADRQATEARLRVALGIAEDAGQGSHRLAALGLAFLCLEALFEAMDHSSQVNVPAFWADAVRAAQASDEETQTAALASAAEKLREAREILYPGIVFLIDLTLADDLPPAELPLPLSYGLPANLIASGQQLETLWATQPDVAGSMRDLVQRQQLEICTGPYLERQDSLRPVESQLWNLRRGIAAYRELFGCEPAVYGRRRFAGLPELPQMLALCGFNRALQISFDEAVMPAYRSALVEWSSAAGTRLTAFTLKPLPADSPLTWFHLAYHLAKTMQQEPTPVLALRYAGGRSRFDYYYDWLELNRMAPIFGKATTLSSFFEQAACGDYPPPAGVDEYLSNYLEELADVGAARPVSRFAVLQRSRQWLDALWTLAAMQQGLGMAVSTTERDALARAEQELETADSGGLPEVVSPQATLCRLADVLVSGATATDAGHLLFNPCNFTRRVGVELAGVRTLLPAPAKATQLDPRGARAVVEVPGLGFAWVPNAVAAGTKVAVHRGTMAEDRLLRNEFLEAEVDPISGGLRTIRTNRLSGGRLGQQLCFGPGSAMVADTIQVVSSGAAMAEIVARGVIRGGQQEVLARYRQHFRVWWGRPILELRIELEPTELPTGYPWHDYFGARFAWRDPKATLARTVGFVHHPTSQARPETPYYLELQSGLVAGRTAILTGGLPFLHRHSQRMVDVVLLPPGETARTFELAVGLDLDDPMQAAIDWITPPLVIPTGKGPPHVGAAGWLFHLDASNLLMTTLRPAEGGSDAIVARIVERRGLATTAELRCPRPPVHAAQVDEFDRPLADLPVAGDAVMLEFAPGAMQRIYVEF